MKKIQEKINRLGLSFKKELAIFIVMNVLLIGGCIAYGIFGKKQVFFGIGPGIAVVFSILYINRYDSKITQINNTNLIEFSELFGFFRIYIKNGKNVYNALKEISNFANDDLRKMIEKLLSEIDEDKTVQPFINFAHNFNEIIIEEMMISIYQMVDDGEQSNYLTQFEFIFDKFSDVLNEKQLRKKNSTLASLTSAPLVGSCFLIIVITIGIVGIIGGISSGL